MPSFHDSFVADLAALVVLYFLDLAVVLLAGVHLQISTLGKT